MKLKKIQFPGKDDILAKELPRVLDEMIKMEGILEHDEDDDEACFSSPKKVQLQVNERVKHQQALGVQLEEEFLSYVSSGIQEILSKRSSASINTSSSTVVPEPPLVPEAEPLGRESNTPSVDPTPSPSSTPDEVPPPADDSLISTLERGEKETNNDDLYNPMMDNSESDWFKEYADQLVGEPRKMKRIINCYMVSRIIAKKLSPKLAGSADGDFRRKLMKMIILFEQWPYRMAWLMVIVENIQQEISLKQRTNSEKGNPIGKNLTSIISTVFGKEKEEDIMALPLLDVYYRLVQTLIHSPTNAEIELLRDGDAQVFEILLAESVAQLQMKDIASISCGRKDNPGLERSIRPYIFNLQMHMVDKVEKYVDNCMVHVARDNRHEGLESLFGVYQPKNTFFNQDYPTSSSSENSPPVKNDKDTK
jgi:hypothetical protein